MTLVLKRSNELRSGNSTVSNDYQEIEEENTSPSRSLVSETGKPAAGNGMGDN